VQDGLGTDQANLRKLVDPSWSVLDLGCGSDPPLLRVMKPKMYYGVDGFKPSIDAVRQRCESQQLFHYEFDVQNLDSVQFDENRFDVVVCVDLIEHLNLASDDCQLSALNLKYFKNLY
jgi:2-polyprenyl-3-methyl-5-hydroxy-6-metoxy-1,4-benzoquinol methylase